MNSATIVLAGAGNDIPMTESVNPLLPAPYDFVWSLIPMAVLLVLFWKFVLPRFQTLLDEREDKIEGGIRRAEETQAEAKAELEKYRAQLAEARTEAAQIREDARTQGQQIIADMKSEAQSESDRIIASGQKQLEAQRQQIVNELRGDIGRQSVDLAEKLMGEQLSDNVRQSGTIDRFLADLDTAGSPSQN